jgi:hypothetical protein
MKRPLLALLLSGVTLSTSVAGSPPRLPDIFVGQWTDTPGDAPLSDG